MFLEVEDLYLKERSETMNWNLSLLSGCYNHALRALLVMLNQGRVIS